MTNYIYLVERNGMYGYDEYDSFVVIADSPDSARKVAASNFPDFSFGKYDYNKDQREQFANGTVTELGVANDDRGVGIVHSSFNAG